MAVEKMYLVNMSAELDDLDNFLDKIINDIEIQPVDVFTQIDNRNFSIEVSEKNLDRTVDFNSVTSFSTDAVSADIEKKIESIEKYMDIKESTGNDRIALKEIDELYEKIKNLIDEKEKLVKERKELEEYINNINILKSLDIDIEKLKDLKFFNFRFGQVSQDGRFILKNNYKNIPSLIFHLKKDDTNIDQNLSILNNIFNIDKKIIKLNDDTEKILESEYESTNNTVLNVEKDYNLRMKEDSKKVYDQIIDEAVKSIKDTNLVHSKNIEGLKLFYENHKKNLEDKFVDEIIND